MRTLLELTAGEGITIFLVIAAIIWFFFWR
jgi:hypothetical protein